MPYIWTDITTINFYLDSDSTIVVGDVGVNIGNFSDTASELMENDAVFNIETILSITWCRPLPTDNLDLQRMAAKLTAGMIGLTRVGSTVGTQPSWAQVYKNEVFAQCIRMVMNAETMSLKDAQLQKPLPPIQDRLIRSKLRDQMHNDSL